MGNATYGQDIPNESGIALFRSANPLNFTLAERLDAAGYAGVPALYREGTGFPIDGNETTMDLEYSFYRTMKRDSGGLPKDTGNNTADFMGVSTNGAATGQGTNLGAPGPENLFSPINRTSQFGVAFLDPMSAATAPPNRERNLSVVPNGTFGTLTLRRTFTNNTGAPVSRLRFRVVEVTTFPFADASKADVRALTSADEMVIVQGNPVLVQGTTLEEPPTQLNGGGWNSSLNVPGVSVIPSTPIGKVSVEGRGKGTIDLSAPLGIGESINVQFRLGVQKTGSFLFFINIEASPCVVLGNICSVQQQ
jgi:hypothetical protein